MYVGIDVSKDRLDVHVLPRGVAFSVPRTGAGLEDLISRLRDDPPTLVVLEATGGFEITVAAAIAGASLPLAVVNPVQIRGFARAVGRLAKTDRLDAEIIALFAERIRPEPRPLPDADARELAEIVARRRQIIEMMIGMESNRQKQARHPKVLHGISTTLAALQAALTTLDQDLDGLIQPLVGLGQLTRRRIAALVGLAPVNRHSGQMRGLRGIAGGRTSVRNALFMASLTAIRFCPPVRDIYQRLRSRGKPAKVALIAAAHKLLTILNAIIRTEKPWVAA